MLSCFIIFIVILTIVFHCHKKLQKLLLIINTYNISLIYKLFLLVFGFSYCIILITYLYFANKTIYTFIYFISGLILYMSTFILIKSMKRYYFSFRIVLFDCLTIIVIVLSSRYYPVNHFRLFSVYKIIGIFFMIGIILVNGVIVYILINVVGKETK